jgi:hypothetical protein
MQEMTEEDARRLTGLAADVRIRAALGKSSVMNRLFDFLLEQSLAGRSPKEVEVAREVFGKDGRFDISQDASVRVYIHRLRRKLDEVYRDGAGERLVIPRGEYRLAIAAPAEVLEEPAPDPEGAPALEEPAVPFVRRHRSAIAVLAALLVGLGLGAMLWSATRPVPTPVRAAASAFWRPLTAAARATYIVAGDYYIFGEARDGGQVTRLVREFAINSRTDLDQYLMVHPEEYSRYVDLDLHYLPVSTGSALRDLVPVANAATDPARARVVPMSRMTPEMLKSANIVYVGFLSALGLLRDPLFEASGFDVGASYDELVDAATGKHYMSDWEEIADNRTPHRDYAYLASFPGPSGNRILIVAGTRDPAVMQAAEIAGDPAQLARIAAAAGPSDAFEALYEVRMLGMLNLDSRLVLARPLKVSGLWQAAVPAQNFPDEQPDPATGPRAGRVTAR